MTNGQVLVDIEISNYRGDVHVFLGRSCQALRAEVSTSVDGVADHRST